MSTQEPVMKDSEMRDGKKSDLEFLVIHFTLMKVYLALLLGLQVGVQKWLVKLQIQFLNLFYWQRPALS